MHIYAFLSYIILCYWSYSTDIFVNQQFDYYLIWKIPIFSFYSWGEGVFLAHRQGLPELAVSLHLTPLSGEKVCKEHWNLLKSIYNEKGAESSCHLFGGENNIHTDVKEHKHSADVFLFSAEMDWSFFFCFLCLSFGLPTVTASFLVVFFPLLHYPFRLCFRSFYTFNLFLMCVCGGVWCARVQVCLLWVFVWCPLLIRRATPCWPDNDLFRWKKWGFIRKWLWLHKANSCVSFPWKRLCKSNALVR